MSPRTLRVSYTIAAPTLQRFNALVPRDERSRVVEQLMAQALADREAKLGSTADAYLTDPAFAICREDQALWDVTAGDGLRNA